MMPEDQTMEEPRLELARVLKRENLREAFRAVKVNRGAPGVDGMDVAGSRNIPFQDRPRLGFGPVSRPGIQKGDPDSRSASGTARESWRSGTRRSVSQGVDSRPGDIALGFWSLIALPPRERSRRWR